MAQWIMRSRGSEGVGVSEGAGGTQDNAVKENGKLKMIAGIPPTHLILEPHRPVHHQGRQDGDDQLRGDIR